MTATHDQLPTNTDCSITQIAAKLTANDDKQSGLQAIVIN